VQARLLRPATEADLPGIVNIEREVAPVPWCEAQFRESLEADGQDILLALAGNVPIGFLVFSLVLDELTVLNLAVRSGSQRLGYGRWLLATVLERHRSIAAKAFLEVRKANLPAIRLYRELGFRQVGVRKGYYPALHGREDALVMVYEYSRTGN